jgi:adenylate cyclase
MIYVGHTGGGGRLGYSILGDCANTAARLENLNKKLGTHILASQSVIEGIGDLELLIRPVGKFALVGKADPTPVVEIIAAKSNALESRLELCGRFSEALDASNCQQWEKASDLFESLLKDFPEDGPSQFYLVHCRNNPTQLLTTRDTDVTVTTIK